MNNIVIPAIELIDNARPDMQMMVEHVVLLPELCTASNNPKSGSTLTITYEAGAKLLELFSLDKHIAAYIGHPVVRDMEFFAQTIGQNCADTLQQAVKITAELSYNRVSQRQRITLQALPQN